MLTNDDFKALAKMIATLLETYGLKKLPSAGALRMQRYRERHAASQNVTPSPEKRHAIVTKRHESVNGSAVAYIPLVSGEEFGVSAEFLKELETAYPDVDGPGTLREIRVWCVANPSKCKTPRGAPRFINSWFERLQNNG